jgi:hypothetical protein
LIPQPQHAVDDKVAGFVVSIPVELSSKSPTEISPLER